jgi:hypothetical protein
MHLGAWIGTLGYIMALFENVEQNIGVDSGP